MNNGDVRKHTSDVNKKETSSICILLSSPGILILLKHEHLIITLQL